MDPEYRIQNEGYRKTVQNLGDSFCPFQKEYQMEVLETFLEKDFKRGNLRVLDACCGQGRLLHYLNLYNSQQQYTGFDYVLDFVNEARARFVDNENIDVIHADIYDLPVSMQKYYDITVLYKTLAWIPDLERVLQALFSVTKCKVYITTPLYAGDIDFEVRAQLPIPGTHEREQRMHYIYGIPRFERLCREFGAQSVRIHELNLPFALPEPRNLDTLQTFTIETNSGEYIELTNIVKLDWKLIEIELQS